MNITVWGINYAPELTGIAPYNTALCEFLRQRGHTVRMVTSFAYYPAWQKAAADGGQLYRDDVVEGVPVHRCWHYVPARPGTLRRILHEGSFVASSLLRLLRLPRPDVFVVVSPPLLLGAAAWLLTRVKPAPVVFHVQDLQPDAALGLGMLKPGWFMRLLYALEAFAYARSARVSAISGDMLKAMAAKGVPVAKLICFPNGVTLPETQPAAGAFRARHGLRADDFVAVYSGNLGVKQGLEAAMRARTMHPGLAGRCDVLVHQDSSVTERFGDFFFLEDGVAPTGGIPISGNAREPRWFAPGTPLRTSRQGVPVTPDFLQTCRSASVSGPLHQWRWPDTRPRVRPCFR
ncbi:MAG: hypothetical protein EB141_09615 [Verrucomicrobia bacterium]|nr:hypothetical protein [Verrucomicrobiota bacterium]